MALPPPVSISPSKLDKFTHCPLAFRYSYLDRIPEPSSVPQVRGTLVHRALELLFSAHDGAARTREEGQLALARAWEALSTGAEAVSLELDEPAADRFLAEAATLVERYFAIEDPAGVHNVGLELHLRAELEGVEVGGIIDRLDELPDGSLVVVDYKTGRSPRPEHSRARLAGVQFYAYLCEQVYGRRPTELRLLYLRDQVVVSSQPSEQSMRGLRQRTLAVWAAIVRACGDEDFRPSPSPLCKSCGYRAFCPAVGGDLRAGAAAATAVAQAS